MEEMGDAGTGKSKVSPEHLPRGARKEGRFLTKDGLWQRDTEAYLKDTHWPKLEQFVQDSMY